MKLLWAKTFVIAEAGGLEPQSVHDALCSQMGVSSYNAIHYKEFETAKAWLEQTGERAR